MKGSCGGEISLGLGSVSTILSPNYPVDYLENIDCKWIVTAPPNTRVGITFSNFSTETPHDTVDVCSGRFCQPTSRLATLSGEMANLRSTQYTSSSNVLSVELKTDGTVGGSGFRAAVSAIEIQAPGMGKERLTPFSVYYHVWVCGGVRLSAS